MAAGEGEAESVRYRVKPMNCPMHILIYAAQQRSYRDLPIRLAEIANVYRTERSGTLHGMLRVRGLTMDDAHIFLREDQIEQEIFQLLDIVELVLGKTFGLSYRLDLATRPDKKLGADATWDQAERALEEALKHRGATYRIDQGGGAFYGPKIDVKFNDAIGREWQGATIQLDFEQPERFRLEYAGEDNKPHRPVMIHRAIYGTLERFCGFLIEHFAGAFPLWLAPEQVRVLPIADTQLPAARTVQRQLAAAGLRAVVDERNETLNYKIRDGETHKVPYMAVVGQREADAGTVAVRARGGDPRRSSRVHSGALRQQGLRLGAQGRHARRPGDQGGRRAVCGRRRDGVDVERAALRLRDARRHQGGEQPARRRDDPRRLVGLVLEHPHGELGGVQCEEGGRVPPGSGRIRAREPSESRRRDDGVPLQGGDGGRRDSREAGSRRDREGRGPASRHDPRGARRAQALIRERRDRDAWERAGPERRRQRARRDLARVRAGARARAPGAHHRLRHGRGRAQGPVLRADRRGPEPDGEGQDADRGLRADRGERGVRGAGAGRRTGARLGLGPRERQRRCDRPGPPDRRVRCARAHDPAVRPQGPPPHDRARHPVPGRRQRGGLKRGDALMPVSSSAVLVAQPLALRRAAAVILGAALVAVAAQVSIPLPGTPVPLTLQPLAVLLVGGLLGPGLGAASLILYLTAGALGLPVFTPYGLPGLARLVGPTGGYLLAYPVAAFAVGRIAGDGKA